MSQAGVGFGETRRGMESLPEGDCRKIFIRTGKPGSGKSGVKTTSLTVSLPVMHLQSHNPRPRWPQTSVGDENFFDASYRGLKQETEPTSQVYSWMPSRHPRAPTPIMKGDQKQVCKYG